MNRTLTNIAPPFLNLRFSGSQRHLSARLP